MSMKGIKIDMTIYHVDVFSKVPYAGNGLTVVFYENKLDAKEMQKIACEFKQFETIFLQRLDEECYMAKIFTVEEELDFAGHPILGAAAVVHREKFEEESEKEITFKLNKGDIVTTSKKCGDYYEVTMNQGNPQWILEVSNEWKAQYCKALNLSMSDLSEGYPMEVVSTGLPYLLVPIKSELEKAKIVCDNFEALLAKNKAKFVYVFDVNKTEGRTWDNFGLVEDVATGSAAGPMGAYLYKHGCFKKEELIEINQGQYVGRPSVIKVSCKEETGEIFVSGDVKVIMKGELYE